MNGGCWAIILARKDLWIVNAWAKRGTLSLRPCKHIEAEWRIIQRSFRSRLRNKNCVLAFYSA